MPPVDYVRELLWHPWHTCAQCREVRAWEQRQSMTIRKLIESPKLYIAFAPNMSSYRNAKSRAGGGDHWYEKSSGVLLSSVPYRDSIEVPHAEREGIVSAILDQIAEPPNPMEPARRISTSKTASSDTVSLAPGARTRKRQSPRIQHDVLELKALRGSYDQIRSRAGTLARTLGTNAPTIADLPGSARSFRISWKSDGLHRERFNRQIVGI